MDQFYSFHLVVREVVHDPVVLNEVAVADDNKRISIVTNGDRIINQAAVATNAPDPKTMFDVMIVKNPRTKSVRIEVAPVKLKRSI